MRMPRTHRHARVEMLPLMDVVFLILVFLIYAMMVMVVHMGMPVALPTSKNAQPEQIVVLALTIRQDGALWLDKDPVTLETLPGEVMRQSRERGAQRHYHGHAAGRPFRQGRGLRQGHGNYRPGIAGQNAQGHEYP